MLEINFFASSKHLLPGAEVGCKLVAKTGGHITAQLPPVLVVVRFKTKQNSIWPKALTMPLTIWNCVLSYQKKICYRIARQQHFATYFLNRWQMGFFRG